MALITSDCDAMRSPGHPNGPDRLGLLGGCQGERGGAQRDDATAVHSTCINNLSSLWGGPQVNEEGMSLRDAVADMYTRNDRTIFNGDGYRCTLPPPHGPAAATTPMGNPYRSCKLTRVAAVCSPEWSEPGGEAEARGLLNLRTSVEAFDLLSVRPSALALRCPCIALPLHCRPTRNQRDDMQVQ